MTVKTANGDQYEVNHKEKTVKKVGSSMKDLKNVKVEELNHTSIGQYQLYIQSKLEKEPVTRKKNFIDVRGYRFVFTAEKIICRDLQKFSQEVDLGVEFPTPNELVTFIEGKAKKRVFSPAELREAAERGKKLLEEREVIPVEEIKITPEQLKAAKEKALRLIGRIEKRQASSDKLYTIAEMIEHRETRVSIAWAFKNYKENKLRWPKLLLRLREILSAPAAEKKPKAQPKFVGLDPIQWKRVDLVEGIEIMVDGKVWNRGEFLAKTLLARDKYPRLMCQLMKFLEGGMGMWDLLQEPVKEDRTVIYKEGLLKLMTPEQVEAVEALWWEVGEYAPTQRRYVQADGSEFKKGMKLLVWWPEAERPGIFEGKVVGTNQGVQVDYGGQVTDLLLNQKYVLHEKENPEPDTKTGRSDEKRKRVAGHTGQVAGTKKEKSKSTKRNSGGTKSHTAKPKRAGKPDKKAGGKKAGANHAEKDQKGKSKAR